MTGIQWIGSHDIYRDKKDQRSIAIKGLLQWLNEHCDEKGCIDLRPREIAGKLHLHEGTVSGYIKALLDEGKLDCFYKNSKDGRRRILRVVD